MYKDIFTSTGWLRAVIFLLLVSFARAAVKLTELFLLVLFHHLSIRQYTISYNSVSIKAKADSVST